MQIGMKQFHGHQIITNLNPQGRTRSSGHHIVERLVFKDLTISWPLGRHHCSSKTTQ